MFTIFGASGNTGSVVANELLARGKKVRVVARDASKVARLTAKGAELFAGDVLDASSVKAALAGAEGAYLLVPPDPQSPDLVARAERIIANYVAGLTANPVAHVVLLSSVAAHEPAGTGPIVCVHRAEKALGALKGTKLTAVRAAYFMENLLAYGHPMKQDGVLPVFGGGETYPFAMVATKDIGKVAAEALLAPPSDSEVIELSGPKEYSFADAAREASTILGRKVTPTVLPIDVMVPTLTGFGLSANVAGLYREMTAAIGTGLIKFDGKGRAIRGTTTMADVLSALSG